MRALIFVLVFFCSTAFAQTTFILVRHAEKEATGTDPGLTKEGEERAESLVKLLEKQNIDAIYSTNFNRTKNTIKPLAESKGLEVQLYEKQPDITRLKGTVVICGHSNTIPALANLLIGKEQFETFDDKDFGNILIIKDGSVTHLRY
jgi:2,3-bisphosphoglycerate-dependent phosphoglycerate mutase